MNDTIDDGGLIAPISDKILQDGSFIYASFGMTLRDWFAGQVISGMCSIEDMRSMPMGKSHTEREEQYEEWAKNDAKWAYRMADAMLAARKEKP